MNKHTIKKLFKKTLSIAAFMLLLFQITCTSADAETTDTNQSDLITTLSENWGEKDTRD